MGACTRRCPFPACSSSGLLRFCRGMDGRRLPIRSPKPSAGHFHHFDVVGLKALVDRSDGAHTPGVTACLGQALRNMSTRRPSAPILPCIDTMRDRPKPQGQDYRRPFERAQYLAACLTRGGATFDRRAYLVAPRAGGCHRHPGENAEFADRHPHPYAVSWVARKRQRTFSAIVPIAKEPPCRVINARTAVRTARCRRR